MKVKISKKYRNKAKIYKEFASEWSNILSFDEDALEECFFWETYGKPVSENNGYAVGKKWLNVFISMWKEDIRDGLLFKSELGKFASLVS